MARSLVAALVLLLAPAVRADFTAQFTGRVGGVGNNFVTNNFTGQQVDVAPGLPGAPIQGELVLVGAGPTFTMAHFSTNIGGSELLLYQPAAVGGQFSGMLLGPTGTTYPITQNFDILEQGTFTSDRNGGELYLVYYHGPTPQFSSTMFTVTANFTYTQVVPEPSSMLLLGIGLAGLGALTLRRRTGRRRAA